MNGEARIVPLKRLLAVAATLALIGCASALKDPLVLAVEEERYEDAWDYVLPLAEAGVADEQVRVATMYARGIGRPADIVEGLKFAILAARREGLLAELVAPAIADAATPEQEAEALARADAFKTTPLTAEWRARWRPGFGAD